MSSKVDSQDRSFPKVSTVKYQPPEEAVNKEMISLLFINDFIDTIKTQHIRVIKERHNWIKTSSHEPFIFHLKNFAELSNHRYLITFSFDCPISYDKSKYHLKGHIMMSKASVSNGDLQSNFSDQIKKKHMFELHENMFSIYLPDKTMLIFSLEDPPLFSIGEVSVSLDYHNYEKYSL